MTADEEGFIEGMSDFYLSVDDAWSRIFAMILGTRQPNDKVKEEFILFIKERLSDAGMGLTALSEDDTMSLFPEFLEYLADGKEASGS
jgi:hypothetical protein